MFASNTIMQEMTIKSKTRDYKVRFTDDFDFIKEFKQGNCILAIDEKVFRLYQNEIFKKLDNNKFILLKASESTKTLKGAMGIYETLLKKAVKRNWTLISIGGGIIQDVTGFVASSLYRGINWVYVPTTLLAQCDSCIGSKTSLNFGQSKNIIGTFYPPSEIYITPKFLETLETKDFYSGLGEAIKLQLMGIKKRNLPLLVKKISRVKKNKIGSDLLKLIRDSLTIKKEYIEDDEFDMGRRNLLNYGHTLGHALESASDFALPHGIAVIIGMIYANLLSLKRNLLDRKTFEYLNKNLFLPNIHSDLFVLRKSYFDRDILFDKMSKDKKKTTNDLALIIPNSDLGLLKINDVKFGEFEKSLQELKKILSI